MKSYWFLKVSYLKIENKPLILVDTNCEYVEEMNSLMRPSNQFDDNDTLKFNENLKSFDCLEDQPHLKCWDFDTTETDIYMCSDKGEVYSKHVKGGPYIRLQV